MPILGAQTNDNSSDDGANWRMHEQVRESRVSRKRKYGHTVCNDETLETKAKANEGVCTDCT